VSKRRNSSVNRLRSSSWARNAIGRDVWMGYKALSSPAAFVAERETLRAENAAV
jgi:hypothetical protein